MYILGLLGFEQVFLRYSFQPEFNTIKTQRFQIKLIKWVMLFTPVLGVYIFNLYFDEIHLNPFLLYLSSLSMVGLLFIFSSFRLNTNFIIAQFISNFWKFSLLSIAIVAFLYKKVTFESIINTILFSIIFIFVLSLIYFLKNIKFIFEENISSKNLVLAALQFFISIITFSFLTFGDRFLVEYKFNLQEFGNYFYLTNFFLAPFSIFQNYIGFKQLIFYKNEFNLKVFDAFNRKFLFFGCILGLLLFGISYSLSYYKQLNFDFKNYIAVIILLILMGIIRLYSASINSAFEAKTNIRSLQRVNLISVLLGIIISFLAVFFSTLEGIVICIIIIWLLRSIIMKKILINQLHSGF